MKRITPRLAVLSVMVLLAGCGNNSATNQSKPVKPSPGAPPPGSGATNSTGANQKSGDGASMGAVTNPPPATDSHKVKTTGPANVIEYPGPSLPS